MGHSPPVSSKRLSWFWTKKNYQRFPKPDDALYLLLFGVTFFGITFGIVKYIKGDKQ